MMYVLYPFSPAFTLLFHSIDKFNTGNNAEKLVSSCYHFMISEISI